jgi:hypothetical protein
MCIKSSPLTASPVSLYGTVAKLRYSERQMDSGRVIAFKVGKPYSYRLIAVQLRGALYRLGSPIFCRTIIRPLKIRVEVQSFQHLHRKPQQLRKTQLRRMPSPKLSLVRSGNTSPGFTSMGFPRQYRLVVSPGAHWDSFHEAVGNPYAIVIPSQCVAESRHQLYPRHLRHQAWVRHIIEIIQKIGFIIRVHQRPEFLTDPSLAGGINANKVV